jgi:cytochrome c-type biogenesis protein CcmE
MALQAPHSHDGSQVEAAPADGQPRAVEVPIRRDRNGASGTASSGTNRVTVIVLCMVTAGVIAAVLGGMQNAGIFAKKVDSLLSERGKFVGKPVRAEGLLVHGTLVKRDSPCEYRFSIQVNEKVMPVRFPQCVVPDTFRDVEGTDVSVTVEGKLLDDNSFEATNVLAKCPSKYEMKQRQSQGEAKPHGAGQAM